ncbi:MAG TPA: acyl-CoA dehydrogenase family protein [Acidimicrobiia bacterium]|nr:acyl-CoA dehydrogenase family protein [Acidimicrobiia bacterium]
MRLELTADQEFFRQTTARFLEDQVPAAELRALRDDPAGYDPEYWRRGAELGWTSLLASEERGGGSISGQGVVDLSLVAYEFGRHAAPGPLATNVVVAALDDTDAQASVLAALMSGDGVASWCFGEPPPHDRLGDITLEARVDGSDVVLNGIKRPVESAAQAGHLLITGRTGPGLTQLLVPSDVRGVTVQPMESVDLTRRFAMVSFDDVHVPADAVIGEVGAAAEQVERQVQLTAVLLCAEAVGAMQSAFDLTVEWAFERYSFGRPLASYQELKHRFADMKAWLEASHAIADAAATATADRTPDAAELASAAKAFVGQYGSELVQDCVQIHGGIGVTFDHDLHLFLRRVTMNRTLCGTPADHRQRLAAILEERVRAA